MSSGGFLRSVRMARKLQLIITAVGLVSALSVSVAAYMRAHHGLEHGAEMRLEAIVHDRRESMQLWIDGIEGDLKVQASSPMVLQAMRAYKQGWAALEGDKTAALQKLYIQDNPNPTGKKEDLDAAPDDSVYSRAHAYFHPYFRSLLRDRGYYDIFLFDENGNCLYTVFKELDFATNVVSGQWKDSDLGNVFRDARDLKEPGKVSFRDFAPYAPSNNVPAAFVSTPVFDAGKFVGVMAFQMPIGTLNGIMQEKIGLGETGESYLVGSDFLMRSDSRFSKESTILSEKVDNLAVRAALEGKEGFATYDQDDISHKGFYLPFDILGVRWAVVADQHEDEALEDAIRLRNESALIVFAGLVLLAFVGVWLGKSFAAPIVKMTDTMRFLAQGDTRIDVPYQGRADEVGDMASAVQVFKDNMLETERLKRAQEEADLRAIEEKKKAMRDMADDFESKVGKIVEGVAAASTEMNASSESLQALADDTSTRSSGVSAAAEETSTNVSTVASATDELSASIAEVTRQIADTVALAKEAETQAEGTNATVQTLNIAASKIGDVVSLIHEIAEQTNLLALNATIEAARAGEAGKGFAVVATEVKNLAGETAKATEEISSQVHEIQNVSRSAVDAIAAISSSIQKISHRIASVSAAAEEQSATTLEISRNVQEASRGTQDVSSNIVTVSESSAETRNMAGDVNIAARELSQQAESLRREINAFLSHVRNG
ncbi:MAG: methyl-accepting chemotaxis protein [Rhodospirillales bacterium]|nr:methyl-accepting chemotaxis protein [Rhodospirillales bacterium]